MSERSNTFVDVLAWIAIIFSGFALFVSVLQNLMLYTVLQEGFPWPHEAELPLALQFFFQHIHVYFASILVCLLVTFVSSVGLLKRKEWARKSFVFMMGVGILYVVAATALQYIVASTIPAFSMGMSNAEATIVLVIRVGTGVFALGIGVLFAWIIKKLRSSEIKSEFIP